MDNISKNNDNITSDNVIAENIMDDLHFRRSIYADPNNQDDDMLAALESDPAKKQLAQDLYQFDEKLLQALKVPVPDDLVNKLLLRQSFASHQQEKRKSRIHLALAASVAITAGLIVNYFQFSSGYSDLGDYALAHVYHEQNYFSNSDSKRVDLTTLNKKMTAFSGSFTDSMGELIAADYCRFDGIKSLHLVFQGLTDIVTVFVVPKQEHLASIAKFSDGKLQGESLNFKNTNILVIADKNESLSKWQGLISKNITW